MRSEVFCHLLKHQVLRWEFPAVIFGCTFNNPVRINISIPLYISHLFYKLSLSSDFHKIIFLMPLLFHDPYPIFYDIISDKKLNISVRKHIQHFLIRM